MSRARSNFEFSIFLSFLALAETTLPSAVCACHQRAGKYPPTAEALQPVRGVGQTSGLPVAKPPGSFAVANRHPEDAFTGRPEVCPTLPRAAWGRPLVCRLRNLRFRL